MSAAGYTCEIVPITFTIGEGWVLKLLGEDGQVVETRTFPLEDEDPLRERKWWNSLKEADRAYWLKDIDSGMPIDARMA